MLTCSLSNKIPSSNLCFCLLTSFVLGMVRAMKKNAVKKHSVKVQVMKALAKASGKAVKIDGAGSSPSVMKKPSSKATGQQMHSQLTEAALAKLEGASDAKIEEFLLKLSDKEQMSLWKKFEHQRKIDGTDEQYRSAVHGVGMKKKSNTCLKLYLKTGGNTKHHSYQQHVTSVGHTKELEQKDAWQPLNFMIQRYGAQELKARVLAGTIECRKNPVDPRFPEFRDRVESQARKLVKEDRTGVTHGGKVDTKAFHTLANTAPDQLMALTFGDEEAEPETAESLAKSFLGGKSSKCKINVFGSKPSFLDSEDPAEEDQFFKDLETASAMEDTTPLSVAALKLLQVKTICMSLQEEIKLLMTGNPSFKKTGAGHLKVLKDQVSVLEQSEKKIKAKSIKAGVLKKVLILAAGAAKKIKQSLLKHS